MVLAEMRSRQHLGGRQARSPFPALDRSAPLMSEPASDPRAALAQVLEGNPEPRDLDTLPDQPASPAVVVDDAFLPGKLTQVSYEPSPGLTFTQAEAVMLQLTVIRRGFQWWIGDAYNAFESRFRRKFAQMLSASDYAYSPGSLRNIAAVCARFPSEKRNPSIDFSMYQEAMSLAGRSLPVAVRTVEHAAENGKSTRQLRADAEDVHRQLDEREQAAGAPSTRPTPSEPLDPPKITYGLHRDVCRTCSCPVVDDPR